MKSSTDERGVIHWSTDDGPPPHFKTWGLIYPPNTFGLEDPSAKDSCHAIIGRYSGWIFDIVNPMQPDQILMIPQPGGVWTPGENMSVRHHAGCPHSPEEIRAEFVVIRARTETANEQA